MPGVDHVQRLLPLVREYGRLEKKRTEQSVTPAEYQRWSELRATLEKSFPQGQRPPGGERRQNLRLPTRMLVEFETQGALQSALIRNISRGGLFIATPSIVPVGTAITLVIRVGAGGETIELPAEVASSGVKGDQGQMGMGCKFTQLNAEQQQVVEEMFATALDAGA